MSSTGACRLQIIKQMVSGFRDHAEVTFEGFNGNGVCEMTFSNPSWAAQQNIFVARDEGAGSQILDQGAVNPWSSQEIKLSQAFEAVTTGKGQAVNQVLLAAAFQFIIQQQRQEFHRVEL